MSIATSTAKIQYTLSATVQALPVPFYFLENAHIKAIRSRSGAADYVMVLGTDYSLAGAADEDGGTLTTIAANMVVGDIITIKRDIAITQTVNYVYNDRFPAETHERALDKLTMIVQQLKEVADRSVQFPESEVAGTGNVMPAASGRAAKILGYDASGNAVQLYDPVSAVFAQGDAIYANSVAALKAVSVTGLLTGQQCHVGGYATVGDGGGGTFVYDSASSATETIGTIVSPNSGAGRWLRIFSGAVNVKWFGAKGDASTDDATAIQLAINTAGAGGAVYFPAVASGAYYKTAAELTYTANYLKLFGAPGTEVRNVGAGACFKFTGCQFLTIEDLNIRGDGGSQGAGATGTYGIDFDGCSNVRLSRVEFRNHGSHAVYFHNGAWDIFISTCIFFSCGGDGISSVSPSSTYQTGNAMSVTDCLFWINGGNGFRWNASGLNVTGCVFEQNFGSGLLLDSHGTTYPCSSVNVTGNYFESNRVAQLKMYSENNGSYPIRNVTITGNHFLSSYVGGGTSLIVGAATTAFRSIRPLYIGDNTYVVGGGTVVNYIDLGGCAGTAAVILSNDAANNMVNLGEAVVIYGQKKLCLSGLVDQKGIAWAAVDKSDDILATGGVATFRMPLKKGEIINFLRLYVETDCSTNYAVTFKIKTADPTTGAAIAQWNTSGAITKVGGGNNLFAWDIVSTAGIYRVGDDTKVFVEVTITAPGSGTYMYAHDLAAVII